MMTSSMRVAVLLLGLLVVCDAARTKTATHTKKGWGNVMNSDGGAEYEYGGEQTVDERQASEFSEKQYESDDPNDDEDGYDGEYNTPETDHPDGDEPEADVAEDEDDDAGEVGPISLLQKQAKAKKTRVKADKKKGWGNLMDSDGGAGVEYGTQTVAEENDFTEKQYESADPNDDENGYDGDYNTAETNHPDEGEGDDEGEQGKDDDDAGDGDSLIQSKKKSVVSSNKKGWGNVMDSDGGADVEYGTQTVAQENDFSEKQYESNDPNDDENGYDGDYNTAETNHPDEGEGDEGEQQNEDDGEDDE